MLKNKKNIGIGIIALVLVVGLSVIGVRASERFGTVTINNVENLTMNVEGSVNGEGTLGASGTRFPNGISADSTSPSAGEIRGEDGTFTDDVTVADDLTVSGVLGYTEKYEALTSTSTVVAADSGSTFYLSGSFQQHTLPATTTPGQIYRFYVGGAVTASTTIATAGGIDSINGTLIVAGAVVDCDDEDTIEFVDNLENIGDFVELRTDGTDWFIGASGGLTSGSITCSAS